MIEMLKLIGIDDHVGFHYAHCVLKKQLKKIYDSNQKFKIFHSKKANFQLNLQRDRDALTERERRSRGLRLRGLRERDLKVKNKLI